MHSSAPSSTPSTRAALRAAISPCCTAMCTTSCGLQTSPAAKMCSGPHCWVSLATDSARHVHPRSVQIQPIEHRRTTQGIDDLRGFDRLLFAIALEVHALEPLGMRHAQKFGVSKNADAAFFQRLRSRFRHVAVHFLQHLRPALDDGRADAQPSKVARKFQPDRAASQHADGLGNRVRTRGLRRSCSSLLRRARECAGH